MGFIMNSIDQKQHINLSDCAWVNIYDDISNFYPHESKSSLSGFLNTIITNYYEDATASISYEIDRLSDQLEDVFLDPSMLSYDKKVKRDFINRMIVVLENETLRKIKSYPKGEARKFRINNENLSMLEDSIEDVYYDGSIGLYLKALLEEYAHKSYFERELIFFKYSVSIIKEAIKNSAMMKITLSNGKKFHVAPYQIITDKSGTFNYLVGISSSASSKLSNSKRIASFRLSRIVEVKIIKSKSGKIPIDLIKKMDYQLNNEGPQFLSGDNLEVKIKLTKEGLRKYKSQINLRPTYTHIENDDIYVFHCTDVQIRYYFFKFGQDATVVSPEYLRMQFKRDYEKSLSNYTQN